MIRKYIINFWIWWYGVQLKEVSKILFSFWSLSIAQLNIVPMMRNVFIPMFGESSLLGRMMSFFFRIGWIIGGTVIGFVLGIPMVCILFLWIFIPFICLIQLARVIL